jgi:hypothetical protein
MKKVFVFTLMFLLVSGISVKAQFEKGKYFVAGSNRLEVNIGGETQKVDGDKVEDAGYSYFDFDFQPRVGYTIIDNLVGGLFMDIDKWSQKDKDDTYGYTYKGTYFVVGPFARYYFPICDKLIPFAEAQVGFGVDTDKSKYNDDDEWDKYKEGVFTYRVGGGATYFFNDMVGADLFLGFLHDAYTHKGDEEGEASRSDHKEKYIYNEFIMQIGIVVLLDK